jgi:hypothetical protein
MRQLQLKKKESRNAWQILGRGIVALDAVNKRASRTVKDDYQDVRRKLISAWRAGVIIGGVRPKHKIHDIMPSQILDETDVVELRRETKHVRAKAKRIIAVPHK